MLRRCTPDTIKARFNGGRGDFAAAAAWFAAALTDARCSSWIAETSDGSVVAVASACRSGDTAEVALVVQDDHQRRRIGVGLLPLLARAEHERGVRALRASLPAERLEIARRFSDQLRWTPRCDVRSGEAEIVVDLGGRL